MIFLLDFNINQVYHFFEWLELCAVYLLWNGAVKGLKKTTFGGCFRWKW